MRFLLLNFPNINNHRSLLSEHPDATNVGFLGYKSLSLWPRIDQISEDINKSKTFLEEVKKRFMAKYGLYSEAEYGMGHKSAWGDPEVMVTFFLRKDNGKFSVQLEGPTLKILRDIFADNSVEFHIKFTEGYLKLFKLRVGSRQVEERHFSLEDISSKGMPVVNSPNHDVLGSCFDDNIEIPKSATEYLKSGNIGSCLFMATISIEVSIPNFEITTHKRLRQCSPEKLVSTLTKNMLEEGVQSDVVIIAGNMSVIKCHKNFLAGIHNIEDIFSRSPVLAAMFRNDCKEATENKIEMPQMTEDGVRSFLAYLYYGDLSRAGDSCQIAFELFEAGHKYEVASLEESVKQIFLGQSNGWFDVEVALRFLTLYGHLEGFEELRKKALQVMKDKYEELEECEEYKNLFATNTKGGMNLFKYALLLCSSHP